MKIKIVLPKHKTRAHIILFVKDTPFKPQKVESKVKFKRHGKHKGKHDE